MIWRSYAVIISVCAVKNNEACLIIGLIIGISLFVADLLWTLIENVKMIKLLNRSQNPNLMQFADALKKEDWHEEIIRIVDERTADNDNTENK